MRPTLGQPGAGLLRLPLASTARQTGDDCLALGIQEGGVFGPIAGIVLGLMHSGKVTKPDRPLPVEDMLIQFVCCEGERQFREPLGLARNQILQILPLRPRLHPGESSPVPAGHPS